MVPGAGSDSGAVVSERLRASWVLLGLLSIVSAIAAGLLIGPADLESSGVILELIDRLPLVTVDSGLSSIHANIIWEVRLPRVVLGALVGATLAVSGASYQAVFRNPSRRPTGSAIHPGSSSPKREPGRGHRTPGSRCRPG